MKSLVYDNILTSVNIEFSVHMYKIGKNFRSVIFVETAKNLNEAHSSLLEVIWII